jgi:hypothetical protein
MIDKKEVYKEKFTITAEFLLGTKLQRNMLSYSGE